MAGHKSYEDAKKGVFRGLWLLAAVTVVEVIVSLFGKGHIVSGVKGFGLWFLLVVGLIITVLSIYKAYFIIYEFMHMRYEVKSLATTVLLPTALLVWAVIAFFQEGNSWKERRQQIEEFDERPAEETYHYDQNIYKLTAEDLA